MDTDKRLVFEQDFLIDEVTMLGWTQFDAAVSNGLSQHVHEEAFEICYIVSGQLTWWVNDAVYHLKRGDYFITKPDEEHGGWNGVMERCELFWFHLHPTLIAEIKPLLDRLHGLKHYAFPAQHDMRALFNRLIVEHTQRREHSALLFKATLYQIVIDVIRAHDQFEANRSHTEQATSPEMKAALQWIATHLTEKFTIADIATAVNLSTSHFQKRFLAEVGLTPLEYCNRKRIEQAQLLFKACEGSIAEVAFAVGFSTSQYFSTVFKKYHGITPREYRAQFCE